MITEIDPNKHELNSQIIAQVAQLVVLFYPIYKIISASEIATPNGLFFIYWFFVCFFIFLNIGSFLQLYFIPYWATIDDTLKTLEVKYLMLPTKLLTINDIEGYSTFTVKKRSGGYFGMILYLSSGKKVMISDINFYDYEPIQLFLDGLKVKKMGEENFSLISYYMHQ
jgi:hypothetical protein